MQCTYKNKQKQVNSSREEELLMLLSSQQEIDCSINLKDQTEAQIITDLLRCKVSQLMRARFYIKYDVEKNTVMPHKTFL